MRTRTPWAPHTLRAMTVSPPFRGRSERSKGPSPGHAKGRRRSPSEVASGTCGNVLLRPPLPPADGQASAVGDPAAMALELFRDVLRDLGEDEVGALPPSPAPSPSR